MLNNRTTPPRTEEFDQETAIWDRLRAEIEGSRRSSVHPAAAKHGASSESVYLEYDDEELSAAMQAEEEDVLGSSPREHEFTDVESVSEGDASEHGRDGELPGRASRPRLESAAAQPPAVPDDDDLHTNRPSYFERMQAEAYQQPGADALAQNNAAALAKAQGLSRWEQAWAEWDKQFDGNAPLATGPVEPASQGRSRLLLPGLALAAVIGLGLAGSKLLSSEPAEVPAPPQAPPTTAQASAGADDREPEETTTQEAADEPAPVARAEEAAGAAPQADTAVVTQEQEPASAKGGLVQDGEETREQRRDRIREERRAARREARHRRREERRRAEAEARAVGSKSDGEAAPAKRKRSGDKDDDPLYGIEE